MDYILLGLTIGLLLTVITSISYIRYLKKALGMMYIENYKRIKKNHQYMNIKSNDQKQIDWKLIYNNKAVPTKAVTPEELEELKKDPRFILNASGDVPSIRGLYMGNKIKVKKSSD